MEDSVLVEDVAPEGERPRDAATRARLMRFLTTLPAFFRVGQVLSAGETFRVVMNQKHVHLFKRGADGFYKPYLRQGRRFVGNVNLFPVPPDYMRVLADLSMVMTMASIAAKLDAIQIDVTNLRNDL